MKLNSAQLQAFYITAQTLHFTKAANLLHVTQSALSQRISNLEEDLETTLFVRDRNFIRLTDAGQTLLRFCQLNNSAESDLLQKLKGKASGLGGLIRIGGFSSVNRSLLVPALAKMMSKNLDLSVQLYTKEIGELASLLKSAEADYILTDTKSPSQEIESLFLGYEENVLVRSKRFKANDIFIDHDENDQTTKNYFSLYKSSLKPQRMRYLDDVYGIIDGVKNGYGCAILSRHLIENEKDLEIVEPKKVLRNPVYLQFFKQPYTKALHNELTKNIILFFAEKLKQN